MDALAKLEMFVARSATPVTLAQCCAAFPRRKASNVRKQLKRLDDDGRICSSAAFPITADERVVSCDTTYKTFEFRKALVWGNAFLSVRPDLADALRAAARVLGPKDTCKLLVALVACVTNNTISFIYTDAKGNKSVRDVDEVGQVFKAQDGFCVWGFGTKYDFESDEVVDAPAPRCFRVDRMDNVQLSWRKYAATGLAYPLVHQFGSKPATKDVWAQHPEQYTEAGAILF